MSHWIDAFVMISQPSVLIKIFLAMIFGGYLGAMPGLTATMGIALLMPFIYFMDPIPAVASIASLAAFAIFAGDIPAALLNIPGTPSSAAYCKDLYLLTQKKQGGMALGICTISSATGSLIGTFLVISGSSILAEFAINFSSFEYFWLAIFGLGTSAVISQDSPLKGTLALLLGLLLSTMGIDITLGFPRFTFGMIYLLGGIKFIPTMIGLFGVSEVIRNAMGNLYIRTGDITTKNMFLDALREIKKYWKHILRSAPLGALIGALPGAGADIAAWVTYGIAKNFSKEPEKFGKGSTEALVASTSANNAGIAGAWIPALVFGIPGDTVTAILIGVFYMKGITPGPLIFQKNTTMVYAIYLTFLFASLMLIPFGYIAVRYGKKILSMPQNILLPIILSFCVVGSYAIENSYFDVIVMLIMGIIGYLFNKNGFPVAPIILGIILGPIVEKNFMMSVMKTNWNFGQFFSRPISSVLLVFAVLTWTFPVIRSIIKYFNSHKKRSNVS